MHATTIVLRSAKGGGQVLDNARELLNELVSRTLRLSDIVYIGVFIATALALRLQFIGQPIRYDEAFSHLTFVTAGLKHVISDYSLPNNHVVYSILEYFSCRLLGPSVLAIRLPALLAGVLLVAAVYWLGRYEVNRSVGIMAAALATTSSPLIEYSTNGRGYTLLCLLTVVTTLVAVLLSRHPRNTVAWGLLAMLGAIGLFTIPIMIYALGGILSWLFLQVAMGGALGGERAAAIRLLMRSAVACGAVTIALYLPALVATGIGQFVGNRFVVPKGFESLPGGLVRLAEATLNAWSRDLSAISAAVVIAGLVISLHSQSRGPKFRVPMSCTFVAFFLLMVLVMRRVPEWPRVVLFALPLVFVWAATGLESLWSKISRNSSGTQPSMIALSMLILALGSYSTLRSGSVLASTETGVLPRATDIVRSLGACLGPEHALFAQIPSDAPLQFYLRMSGLPEIRLNPMNRTGYKTAFVVVNAGVGQTFAEVVRRLALGRDFELNSAKLHRVFGSAHVYVVRARPSMLSDDGLDTCSLELGLSKG